MDDDGCSQLIEKPAVMVVSAEIEAVQNVAAITGPPSAPPQQQQQQQLLVVSPTSPPLPPVVTVTNMGPVPTVIGPFNGQQNPATPRSHNATGYSSVYLNHRNDNIAIGGKPRTKTPSALLALIQIGDRSIDSLFPLCVLSLSLSLSLLFPLCVRVMILAA